jgi:hypothetical protein
MSIESNLGQYPNFYFGLPLLIFLFLFKHHIIYTGF